LESIHGIIIQKTTCWLGWFCVDPAYRRKGIGKRLLEFILKYAKRKGYKIFCIETTSHEKQKAAMKLFKKFGFKKVGRIKNYYKSFDLIYLSKKLR